MRVWLMRMCSGESFRLGEILGIFRNPDHSFSERVDLERSLSGIFAVGFKALLVIDPHVAAPIEQYRFSQRIDRGPD
jgi:hypothetical protein